MSRFQVLVVTVAVAVCSMGGSAEVAGPGQPAKSGPAAQLAAANVDFNGDGLDDLAISAPGESIGAAPRAGAVHVLYGSSSGLTAANSQSWSQESSGIDGSAEPLDEFGSALATADFDGDGFSDLAVGVPLEDIGSTADAGLVHILYGSSDGLQATRSQVWSQNATGISGTAEPDDQFGGSLLGANLGRGIQSDLVIGAAREAVGARSWSGVVHLLYGSAAGLAAGGSQLWSQNSAGITGSAEPDDFFGHSLTAADLGGSSIADLVIGVPGEALRQEDEAGGVHVLYGSTSGLNAAGSQFWSQDSQGIPDRPELFDGFGSSLVAADFGGTAHADLAIGASGESLSDEKYGAGMVHVLYGSSTGLSVTGSQVWHQDMPGVPGVAEPNDFFGRPLTAGDFGRSGHADLAIGMPRESASSVDGAGGVQILYGATSGLGTAGNQVFNQNTPGIAGTAEESDEFASSLAAGNFDGNGHDDLVVGVPYEFLGGEQFVGVVHLIRGSGAGLTSVGSQLWTQDSPDIADSGEPDDLFGRTLSTG